RAVERPRKLVAGPPDEERRRDGDRQPLRELRQHGDLTLGAGHDDLPTREAESPLVVDPEDGVVPALAHEHHLSGSDLLELPMDDPPRPLLVDVLFGGPDLRHARARRRVGPGSVGARAHRRAEADSACFVRGWTAASGAAAARPDARATRAGSESGGTPRARPEQR